MNLMKIRIFVLFVTAVFIAGCKSLSTDVSYSPYIGSTIFKGEGGTVEMVDGMPFWNDGTPNQTYQIIGVVDTSIIVSPFAPFDLRHDVAKIAQEHGGDAVVLRDSNQVFNTPDAAPMRYTKWIVVKYVQPDTAQPTPITP
jgi:hypothetical protein